MADQEPKAQGATAPATSDWDAAAVAQALVSGKVRGVRLWYSAPDDAVIAEGAEQAGWRHLALDTDGVTTKADYITTAASQLPLPDYTGRNWDALEEALGDQGVDAAKADATGLLVVWRNWADFAAAESSDFQVALAIWRSVATDWRERLDGGAVVLVVDTPAIPADLPESVVEELTGISRLRNA